MIVRGYLGRNLPWNFFRDSFSDPFPRFVYLYGYKVMFGVHWREMELAFRSSVLILRLKSFDLSSRLHIWIRCTGIGIAFFFIIGYQLSLLVETFLKIFLKTWSLASFTYTDIKWCLRCKGNRACFFLRCFYPSLEIFRSFISFAYLDKVYEAWTVQIIRVVFFLN